MFEWKIGEHPLTIFFPVSELILNTQPCEQCTHSLYQEKNHIG